MNVPKLRFKDDDGQEYPDWCGGKLGEIGSVLMCKRILKEQTQAVGDVPFYKIGTFGKQADAYISNDVYESFKQKYSFPKKGDILISAAGTIGRTVVYDGLPAYFQDSNIVWIENNEQKVRNAFLYYLYAKTTWNTENTTIARLYNDNLKSIFINFPSLPEQTKIANFLTAVDEKTTQLTQKSDLLAQYKKGVMQKIFSQELRFKDDDGREFPGWVEKSLGAIAKIIGGGTPDTAIEDYWQGSIQWFTPTELKTKYVSESKRTISDMGLKNSSAKVLPAGTLLLSSRATVGDVSIALNECTTNQGFQSLIVNDENNNEFVYYWLTNNKKSLLERASGSTFLEISKREIEKLVIQTPVKNEQTKIANFLSAIDDKIIQTQAELDAMNQYKKGLLQQMFV